MSKSCNLKILFHKVNKFLSYKKIVRKIKIKLEHSENSYFFPTQFIHAALRLVLKRDNCVADVSLGEKIARYNLDNSDCTQEFDCSGSV